MDDVSDLIRHSIRVIRGQRVLLDADLARLYGVETRTLVQAVTRNAERFPSDFMFQLEFNEVDHLRSQFVMSRWTPPAQADNSRAHSPRAGWGGRRTAPYAFTEQGVAMLSSVLRSKRAIEVNVEIMRTFVQLRRMLASHEDLARRLDDLEQRYDGQFASVFEAITLRTRHDDRSASIRTDERATPAPPHRS